MVDTQTIAILRGNLSPRRNSAIECRNRQSNFRRLLHFAFNALRLKNEKLQFAINERFAGRNSLALNEQ